MLKSLPKGACQKGRAKKGRAKKGRAKKGRAKKGRAKKGRAKKGRAKTQLSEPPSLPTEEVNIDPTFESQALINYENVSRECFLGTASEIMPPQSEIDQMMTGVDLDYDYNRRLKWGDGPNAEFFDEWSYYIPWKKTNNIGMG